MHSKKHLQSEKYEADVRTNDNNIKYLFYGWNAYYELVRLYSIIFS